MVKSVIDRFLDKVSPEPNTGCWLWLGATAGDGYGHFWIPWHGSLPSQRAALVLFSGMDPATSRRMHADHRCGCRLCVNPDHLELVTAGENIKRRDIARFGSQYKRRCVNGHDRTLPGAVYVSPKGKRNCRECLKLSAIKEKHRRAANTAMLSTRVDL